MIGKKLKKRLNIPKPMTICIAAICDVDIDPKIHSPGIIFCADRWLSSSIGFEHGIPKIKQILERAIIMEAGDGTISDIILDKEMLDSKNSSLDIEEIANMLNKKVINVMKQKVDEALLLTFGFDTDFFQKNSKLIDSELLNMIFRHITKIRQERAVEFIVAGLNKDSTPHIYKVSSINGIECYDSIGFLSIGIGADLSLIELTKSEHNDYESYSEVIFKVYHAKKESEKAGNIGQKTDLGIIYLESADKNNKNWVAAAIPFEDKVKKMLEKEFEKIRDFETKLREQVKPKLNELILAKKVSVKRLL